MNAAAVPARHEVWVLCEQDKDVLDAGSSLVLAHAALLRQSEPGLVLRALLKCEAAAPAERVREQLRAAGVAEIFSFEGGAGSSWSAGAAQALLASGKPLALLCPGTPAASELAGRLSGATGAALVADCLSLRATAEGGLDVAVTTAGGMAELEIRCAGPSPCILVMPLREAPTWEAREPAESAAVSPVAGDGGDVGADGLRPFETRPVAAHELTLAEATVIVAGGRGLGGPEPFEELGRLAALLGGHVGASRVATDLGWISRDHLVGMSGSTVRPALYLAFGISGAPHHLMGMRDASVIVAVNQDPAAPIFQHATHAFVGDLFEIVPGLIGALANGQPAT